MSEIKLTPCCGEPPKIRYLEPLRCWAVECSRNGHIHNTGFCESREEAIRVWQAMTKTRSEP